MEWSGISGCKQHKNCEDLLNWKSSDTKNGKEELGPQVRPNITTKVRKVTQHVVSSMTTNRRHQEQFGS